MNKKIKTAGKKIQNKKTKIPPKTTRISKAKPAKMRKNLKIAPIILEIKLEAKTSRYFPGSNPLGYCQKYLCQCEKKVLNKKGREK